MRKKQGKIQGAEKSISERNIYVLLLVAGIVLKIPLWKHLGFVTFDGTYYINHAKYLLGRPFPPSGFPAGYPLFTAALIPLLGDGVRAARAVSLLAGLGLPLVVYSLARRFVQRKEALVAPAIVLLSPLMTRFSVVTMSESLYVLWLFLGILLYSRGRWLTSGLSLGLAAIIRPEALGAAALLAVLKRRSRKALLLLLAGFAVLYSVNVVLQSRASGRLVLLPKSKLLGDHAANWKLREQWIEFDGKEYYEEIATGMDEKRSVAGDYLRTVPKEFLLLAGHLTPAVLLLALFGIWKRRSFLLAALLPFFVFPLFVPRSEPRFILPYIPALAVYASIGLAGIGKDSVRKATLLLTALFIAAGIFFNRGLLVTPVSAGNEWAKPVGERLGGSIRPWDGIADRKPFFAFYAGGRYTEIPVGPYDDVLDDLYGEGVEYLVLHRNTIHNIRPKLRPLLYDEAVISGELRYSQVYFLPGVMALFRRNRDFRPYEEEKLISPDAGMIIGLAWSPDGEKLAFRLNGTGGEGDLFYLDAHRTYKRVLSGLKGVQDPLCWTPDSRRILMAYELGGNVDIYSIGLDGGMERLTTHEGIDMSPFLSRDGGELVFCSDRGGGNEIWLKDLRTGLIELVAGGGDNRYPSMSPDSRFISWVRVGQGVIVLDRAGGGQTVAAPLRRAVMSAAWRPDGRYMAVTGGRWGRTQVFLCLPGGGRIVQLIDSNNDVGNPSWSPDGTRIAAVKVEDERTSIVILSGLDPWIERLVSGPKPGVFDLTP